MAMNLHDSMDRTAEEAFRWTESHWLDRVPPELEWDESEVAIVVAQIVGASPMRSYA
jgi:hypothetical protein